MSAIQRRGLRVDDPLAGRRRHRRPGPRRSAVGAGFAEAGCEMSRSRRSAPTPASRASASMSRRWPSLADSIRERGVLQPVIVRPVGDGYELVAGERRWRAAELAGEATIPALVDGALDEAGSLELALIENVVREDLDPDRAGQNVRGPARRPADDRRGAREAARTQPSGHREHGAPARPAR